MSIEHAPRRLFAISQVLVGLVVPAVYVTSLTTYSLTEMDLYQMGYWLGVPAACFFVLAWASLIQESDKFWISRSGMWGAAIAGYLALVLPAMLMLFASVAAGRGGGANIGVALLSLAMPIYLPVLMIIGLGIGTHRENERKRHFEKHSLPGRIPPRFDNSP